MREQYSCWNCGSILSELILPISRREQCRQCRAEQHVCKMCRYYRPQLSIPCDEERADPPSEVESANFCDYFSPLVLSEARVEMSKAAAAKAELDALFGGELDKTEDFKKTSKKDQALDELNRLFGGSSEKNQE